MDETSTRTLSSPTIGRVMQYDLEIRKHAADALNRGVDFKTALREATEDDKMRRKFLCGVVVDAATPAAKAVSAPGVDKSRDSSKRKADAKPEGPSKTSRKRARVAEMKRQLAEARTGGNGAGAAKASAPPPAPKAGTPQPKGKGKGDPLPAGAHGRTGPPENAFICWGYNKAAGCQRNGCSMKHVCWYCFAADHTGAACPNHRR